MIVDSTVKPNRFKNRLFAAGAAAFATVSTFAAQPPAPDKSRFTLFHPTPRELMREMSTDRPDKTESAYTVDAGHFQMEMDMVSYSYDRYNPDHANTRVESFAVAPVNLKIGLLNQVDFQLILQTWNHVRIKDRDAGTTTTQQGFGDTLMRLKWNLWGNDSGDTALALMPYVKLPTNQDDLGNDSVEGGLIVPFAVSLPAGWGMGLMTQFDLVRDGDDSGYHSEFVNTVTLSHDIVGKLGGYVEFFSSVSTERGSGWVGTVDLGLTYALTDDIQLDAGINIGVTRAADDWNPFVGLSWRF